MHPEIIFLQIVQKRLQGSQNGIKRFLSPDAETSSVFKSEMIEIKAFLKHLMSELNSHTSFKRQKAEELLGRSVFQIRAGRYLGNIYKASRQKMSQLDFLRVLERIKCVESDQSLKCLSTQIIASRYVRLIRMDYPDCRIGHSNHPIRI